MQLNSLKKKVSFAVQKLQTHITHECEMNYWNSNIRSCTAHWQLQPVGLLHMRSTRSEAILWLWPIRICSNETSPCSQANWEKKKKNCPYSKPLTWLLSISILKSIFCFPLLK